MLIIFSRIRKPSKIENEKNHIMIMLVIMILIKVPQFIVHSIIFFICNVKLIIVFWVWYYYFIIISFNRC